MTRLSTGHSLRYACSSLAACGFALLLAACGGGGGGSVAGGIGGTGTPVTASGAVSGFGSVIVNGLEFAINNTGTAITVNDATNRTQADLRVGMVVTVEGSKFTDSSGNTTYTANSITYRNNVIGPVQSTCVPGAAVSLTVLGQPVRVDNQTNLDDGFACSGTPTGVVEVSGFADANGTIRATLIRNTNAGAGSTLEVRGVAQNVDVVLKQFRINTLVVNYGQAEKKNFPANESALNGAYVEVKGTLLPNSELNATKVEVKTSGSGGAAQQAEAEGIINQFISSADFQVNGQRVTTNSSTVYEPAGASANDLALNKRINVSGNLSAGVLTAARVRFEQDSIVEIEGDASSAGNGSTGSFSVFGSPGITVKVDTLTTYKDSSNAKDQTFNLTKIKQGNHLRIAATQSNNDVTATRVERLDADNKAELRGVVEQTSNPTFTILGVTVDTSSTSSFKDANGQSVNRTAFFAGIQVDTTIAKAKGQFSNNKLLADDEASLEQD